MTPIDINSIKNLNRYLNFWSSEKEKGIIQNIARHINFYYYNWIFTNIFMYK